QVLEVLFRRSSSESVEINARGTLYTFTAEGTFDPRPFAEATSELGPPHLKYDKDRIVDITRILRSRRWRRELKWQISPEMVRRVEADVDGAGLSGPGKIRSLKRPRQRAHPAANH